MTLPHLPRLATVAAAAFLAGCTAAANQQPQQSGESFRVFCVNKRIEIGSRTLDDMREARGPKVCLRDRDEQPSPTLAEAATKARKAGGVGAPCDCPRR